MHTNVYVSVVRLDARAHTLILWCHYGHRESDIVLIFVTRSSEEAQRMMRTK